MGIPCSTASKAKTATSGRKCASKSSVARIERRRAKRDAAAKVTVCREWLRELHSVMVAVAKETADGGDLSWSTRDRLVAFLGGDA